MNKEDIIEELKEKIEDYMFQSDVDSYIKGYLDALIRAREIDWDERYDIEERLKNE